MEPDKEQSEPVRLEVEVLIDVLDQDLIPPIDPIPPEEPADPSP